jgi:hypothetical protein
VRIEVNGRVLNAASRCLLLAGARLAPGRYWYDPDSGLYGLLGQAARGHLVAHLPLGRASRTASGGSSGVFVNGRQVDTAEAASLGLTRAGRFLLDEYGQSTRIRPLWDRVTQPDRHAPLARLGRRADGGRAGHRARRMWGA